MILHIFSISVSVVLLISLGLWISIAYRWKRMFLEERKRNEELIEMYFDSINSVNGIAFRDWISKVLDNSEMMEEQNGKQTDSVDE